MDKRLFKSQELIGILGSLVITLLLWQLYTITNGNPIGIIFGCVNQSIWEQLKALILSYVLLGTFELFTSKPYFRQFVVAKSTGLYCVIAVYIIIRYLSLGAFSIYTNIGAAIVSLALGYTLSYFLTNLHTTLRDLFIPCCFMLLLIFVMFFSFTVFTPQLSIFVDPDTGMYGIIPQYIDTGAMVLDALMI